MNMVEQYYNHLMNVRSLFVDLHVVCLILDILEETLNMLIEMITI